MHYLHAVFTANEERDGFIPGQGYNLRVDDNGVSMNEDGSDPKQYETIAQFLGDWSAIMVYT